MFKQFVKVSNLNWTAVVNTKLPIFNLTKSQQNKKYVFFLNRTEKIPTVCHVQD